MATGKQSEKSLGVSSSSLGRKLKKNKNPPPLRRWQERISTLAPSLLCSASFRVSIATGTHGLGNGYEQSVSARCFPHCTSPRVQGAAPPLLHLYPNSPSTFPYLSQNP